MEAVERSHLSKVVLDALYPLCPPSSRLRRWEAIQALFQAKSKNQLHRELSKEVLLIAAKMTSPLTTSAYEKRTYGDICFNPFAWVFHISRKTARLLQTPDSAYP